MAGEAGLYRNLRGLGVADLADHHHVRVLAQDRAQAGGEGHADTCVDLGLADTVDGVFHRVFHGEDIARAIVEQAQCRV